MHMENGGDGVDTRRLWDRLARDWYVQVGDHGDSNRQLNSDPLLWEWAADVRGLRVLDAGCGTGYLLQKLQERGAAATGVDFSEEMIAVAREQYPDLDLRVDDCQELVSIRDSEIDLLVSNYVLMDLPDLGMAADACSRVLKTGGRAIVIISHPCFPQAQCRAVIDTDNREESSSEDGMTLIYTWPFSYFEEHVCIDPPWKHFRERFVHYHRPLSDYWSAFSSAGMRVLDFREPRVTPDRYHLAESDAHLRSSRNRPYSAAFLLEKGP